jgi:hypothetical protein
MTKKTPTPEALATEIGAAIQGNIAATLGHQMLASISAQTELAIVRRELMASQAREAATGAKPLDPADNSE